MEEKNTIKFNLSTVLLILTIIVIIIMGFYIFKMNNEKNEEVVEVPESQNQIDDVSDTEDYSQNTFNEMPEILNSNETNTKEPITRKSIIDENAIKASIQKYLDFRQVIGTSTIDILVELGLETSPQSPDDYDGFTSDKPYPNSYFLVTDVDYSDFENALAKYMSVELFKSKYPDYVINKDGKLCIYSDGGSSGSSVLKEFKVLSSDSNKYTCSITITEHADDDGSNRDEKHIVNVIKKDNVYIVSDFE